MKRSSKVLKIDSKQKKEYRLYYDPDEKSRKKKLYVRKTCEGYIEVHEFVKKLKLRKNEYSIISSETQNLTE